MFCNFVEGVPEGKEALLAINDELLSNCDIKEFISKCKEVVQGLWLDITYDLLDLSALPPLPKPGTTLEVTSDENQPADSASRSSEIVDPAESLTPEQNLKSEALAALAAAAAAEAKAAADKRQEFLLNSFGELVFGRLLEKNSFRIWAHSMKKVSVPFIESSVRFASDAVDSNPYHLAMDHFPPEAPLQSSPDIRKIYKNNKSKVTGSSKSPDKNQKGLSNPNIVDICRLSQGEPVRRRTVWDQSPLLATYKEDISKLPPECHTTACVLYCMTRAVTAVVAAAMPAERKKCRGGGMLYEWQQVTGAYVLPTPPVTTPSAMEPIAEQEGEEAYEAKPRVNNIHSYGVNFNGNYYNARGCFQHRVLASSGTGTRGFITFPASVIPTPNESKSFIPNPHESKSTVAVAAAVAAAAAAAIDLQLAEPATDSKPISNSSHVSTEGYGTIDKTFTTATGNVGESDKRPSSFSLSSVTSVTSVSANTDEIDLTWDVFAGTCSALLAGVPTPVPTARAVSEAESVHSRPTTGPVTALKSRPGDTSPVIEGTPRSQLGSARSSAVANSNVTKDVMSRLLMRPDVILFDGGSQFSFNVARNYQKYIVAEKDTLINPLNPSVTELSQFEHQAIAYSQISQLLNGESGLPLHPQLSIMERSLQESELLTFSSLSVSDIHKFLQLQQLESIIHKYLPATQDYTGALQEIR